MFEDFRLRVFTQVASLGSFTAAAKALGVSQPAVSQHIAELEKSAGGKLFERERGSVSLTARGRLLLEHAERILSEYKRLDGAFRVPDSILLKDVLHAGQRRNILIQKDRFTSLDAPADTPADCVVEAAGTAILPAFFNAHAHAATTVLRGRGDDPALEGSLEPEDVRRGDTLAIREMNSAGTTFFSEMFFDPEETVAAVEASGLRAAVGITLHEGHPKAQGIALRDYIKSWKDPSGGRIQLTMAPRSVLAVSTDELRRAATFARQNGLLLHIQVARTRREVDECVRRFGMTPVRYLHKIGFLGSDVLAAHCVHVDEQEWKLLASQGVTVAHCPRADLRVAGARFPYRAALDAGCRIALGTDGVAGGGSLDLLEEMKFAALLAAADGCSVPADEILRWATRNGAEFYGIDAGQIAVGRQADAILADLDAPRMQPGTDPVRDWVLSADSSVIRQVLCAGRIIYSRPPVPPRNGDSRE